MSISNASTKSIEVCGSSQVQFAKSGTPLFTNNNDNKNKSKVKLPRETIGYHHYSVHIS